MIGRYSRNHDNILTSITRKITEARRENLLRAVRKGDVAAVTKYVAKYGDNQGNTLLLNGVRNNNRALVRIALDRGASMSHQNLQGDNALLMAVKAGNTMMLTYLLERMTANPQSGVDINEAFIAAVTRNNEAMVDIIYKYGVDLNYICRITGRTALETALHLELKGLSDKLFKLENDAKISDTKQPPAPVRQPSLLGKFGLLGVKDVSTDGEAPQSSAALHHLPKKPVWLY